MALGQAIRDNPAMAFAGSPGAELTPVAQIQFEQCASEDECIQAGEDAVTTILDRTRLPGCEEPSRHGTVPGTEMAILASPYGPGHDGLSVHAARENAKYH